MDRIEEYVDQVCRSIGGPRSLRQHVRQELREHLRDAVAQHQAAGLAEEEALARALADFGGPEQVRSELEATHGHRLLPVVIDKAMQWKEMTMRARWLWTTWTYLAVVLVIAMQLGFLVFESIWLLPKMKKLREDGWFDPEGLEWFFTFLAKVDSALEYLGLYLLGALTLWGLFEWRVRSENKPFMRLSALGTISLGLMVVVGLTAASLILPFMLSIGPIARGVPVVMGRLNTVEYSVRAIEQFVSMKDWGTAERHCGRVILDLVELEKADTILATLVARGKSPNVDEVRTQLKAARSQLLEAQSAIQREDAEKAAAALRMFREVFDPLRDSVKQPVK